MPSAYNHWTVHPHGSLQRLADNLYCVDGSLPNMPMKRRFTIVRWRDGRLLFHNPVALEEEVMREIEALGSPDFIVVPSGWHRLDAKVFKDRYPSARVLCPLGSRPKVSRVVSVNGTYSDFQETSTLKLRHLEGVENGEGVLEVHSDDGVSLVFNDAVFNLSHFSGLFGTVYRWVGSTGGPKVTRIFRWLVVKDREALRADLVRLSDTPNLRRVVMSHGEIIRERAPEVLRSIAATA